MIWHLASWSLIYKSLVNITVHNVVLWSCVSLLCIIFSYLSERLYRWMSLLIYQIFLLVGGCPNLYLGRYSLCVLSLYLHLKIVIRVHLLLLALNLLFLNRVLYQVIIIIIMNSIDPRLIGPWDAYLILGCLYLPYLIIYLSIHIYKWSVLSLIIWIHRLCISMDHLMLILKMQLLLIRTYWSAEIALFITIIDWYACCWSYI